jgi:hypothetical protein
MKRLPLPMLDPSRTEFGFDRTCCACTECATHCRHVPGYLVPDDLLRMATHVGPETDLLRWAKDHLLASPGAIVARNGRAFRIPTLVPAHRADGACIFLTSKGMCSIHALAPFGCAFIDSHMTAAQVDLRSVAGLRAVARAWQDGDLYPLIWHMLAQVGLVAMAPEEARNRQRLAAHQRGL